MSDTFEWEEWNRPKPSSKRNRLEALQLVNYFSYHRNMSMNQQCEYADKRILWFTLNKLIKNGYTEDSIRNMIDRFYQSWASEYDRPVQAFASKKVLDKLTTEAEIVEDDPILAWLLNGMPDVGPLEDTKQTRKLVMLACTESLHRYPDLVADILRYGFGPSTTKRMLDALEDLIVWNLLDGGSDGIHLLWLDLLNTLSLPVELGTGRRSPKAIRPKYEQVHQAIAAIPISKKRRVKEDEW